MWTPQPILVEVLEAVGRHNALDKLLGARAQAGALWQAEFLVMSSRASFELVRKCARLQVPLLAAISAPTDLAIQMAEIGGLQLWGLCRGTQAVRYSKCREARAISVVVFIESAIDISEERKVVCTALVRT